MKYTSTVDIKSFRLLLKDLKDATSLLWDPDVQQKLSLGNVSLDFRQHLSQSLHVSDIAKRIEDLKINPGSSTCMGYRMALGTFLIHSGELSLIDELHSILVNLSLSTVCHMDLLQLEETLLLILWHVCLVIAIGRHQSFYTFPCINFENVVCSFCRVQVTACPFSPYMSSLSMKNHISHIIFYSLQVLLK